MISVGSIMMGVNKSQTLPHNFLLNFETGEYALLEEEAQSLLMSFHATLLQEIAGSSAVPSQLLAIQVRLAGWLLARGLHFFTCFKNLPIGFFQTYFDAIGSAVEDRELQTIFYAFGKIPLSFDKLDALQVTEMLELALPEKQRLHLGNPKKELASKIATQKKFTPPFPMAEFEDVKSYHCAACHPSDAHSLHMRPAKQDGKQAVDHFVFPRKCEGYNGIVHGGFLAMAMEEVMVYAVVHHLHKVALTTELKLNFLRPVYLGQTYKILGKILDDSVDLIKIEGQIVDEGGEICATASGDFILPTLKIGTRLFGAALTDHPFARRYFKENG